MSVTTAASTPVGRLGFARREDVDLFVQRLEAFERGELTPDEWRSFRLLNGVYGQRQDGVNMVRAKLPGGIVTPAQLVALAEVGDRFAGSKGHVTTRQNMQFHFVKSSEAPDALGVLEKSGITTKEACGHSVRNWTCCPFAGVSREEPFDPTPYVEALARHLLRGPLSSTLPRKFKPSVGGCCGTDCSQATINDLGFLARVQDGKQGFKMVAGGGLSTLRRSAIVVEEFVPLDELFEAANGVLRVFNRIGNRNNKAKARLKWAIDKVGVPAFLADYRAEREKIRAEGGIPLVVPPQPEPISRRAPLAQVSEPAEGFAEWRATNVRAQKQNGFSAIVIRLALGDISSDQMRELAQIAVQYGEGEVRFTNEQNIVLRWVPDARLAALHRELVRVGLAKGNANTVADVTSCPGATSCKLAVTSSKGFGAVLTDLLDRRPDLVAKAKGLDIKISGCPHGCGQHYVSGIGFQGGMRKVAGRPAPQYLVYVGGGISAERADFGKLLGKVPARKGAALVERLVEYYVAKGGTNHTFWTSVPVDELKAMVAEFSEMSDGEASELDFIDLGETTAFEVATAMEGECAS